MEYPCSILNLELYQASQEPRRVTPHGFTTSDIAERIAKVLMYLSHQDIILLPQLW